MEEGVFGRLTVKDAVIMHSLVHLGLGCFGTLIQLCFETDASIKSFGDRFWVKSYPF